MVWTGGQGLTQVSTEDLKRLLALVHRGEVSCPLTTPEMTRCGLQHLMGNIGVLRNVDEAGVRAVLVSVLAERNRFTS